MRSEGFYVNEKSTDTSWDRTATFRFVTQHLNHCVTAVCVENIWINFKDIIFKGTKRYAPQEILSTNADSEYYNKEVERLKIKARKM